MFSLKISTISKSKIFIGYVNNYCCFINERKRYLWTLTIEHCVNTQNNRGLSRLVNCSKKFGSEVVQKDYNVFGNISNEQYEKFEMDKDEKMEETVAEGAKIPRYQRLSHHEYCRLIKSYVDKKNVKLALSVLDLMKESGDKPDLYIYRLLISAFAIQGDVKQCFQLFKKLKDSGLKPSPRIYTSLIEACAQSNNKELALDRLKFLRLYFHEKQINLNEIQYCALIKAYGRNNQIITAFELADEAQDNKCYISNSMMCALFQATIADKKCGLKYALALWHKMKKYKMKMNIYHYNLLLRAIRDTGFGNMKVKDILFLRSHGTQIQFKDTERPDLLNSPPLLNTSFCKLLEGSGNVSHDNITEVDMVNKVDRISLNLDNTLQKNRLILFGGAENILKRMKCDGVVPNEKTITLILDLLPSTVEAEDKFLRYLKQNSINIDITFFNVLIKKRCMRNCYEDAKSVVDKIQTYHFMPNIVTFGVLAIGCTKFKDGVELLQQMNNIGYVPNNIILETLLLQACYTHNISYVSYLMTYILKNQIEPSKEMLTRLERFDEIISQLIDNQVDHRSNKLSISKTKYDKFKINYEIWKEKLEMTINHSKN